MSSSVKQANRIPAAAATFENFDLHAIGDGLRSSVGINDRAKGGDDAADAL
ncbi:MAG: hypothetical protein U1F83_15595 [Verrucomicrobiota bacterium]